MFTKTTITTLGAGIRKIGAFVIAVLMTVSILVLPFTAFATETSSDNILETNHMTVFIDVGSEYSYIPSIVPCDGYFTEVIDDVIFLPEVSVKDGYTFIGWSKNGESTPVWDTDAHFIELSELEDVVQPIFICALYKDTQGNVYCSSGAFQAYGSNHTLESMTAPSESNTSMNMMNIGTEWAGLWFEIFLGVVMTVVGCFVMFSHAFSVKDALQRYISSVTKKQKNDMENKKK